MPLYYDYAHYLLIFTTHLLCRHWRYAFHDSAYLRCHTPMPPRHYCEALFAMLRPLIIYTPLRAYAECQPCFRFDDTMLMPLLYAMPLFLPPMRVYCHAH